jgi:hypothetical protein
MPIGPALVARLKAFDAAAITQADTIISAEGYDFIGYHGTNVENMRAMVPFSISTAKVGSEAGTSSGPGFYLAFTPKLAVDFASIVTKTTVTKQTKYGEEDSTEPRQGLAGQEALLRVYALHFLQMQDGVDYIWTKMGGGGPGTISDLELVVQKHRFERLAVLPTTLQIDSQLSARVPPPAIRTVAAQEPYKGRADAFPARESPR